MRDARKKKGMRIAAPEPPDSDPTAEAPELETGGVVEDLWLRDADLSDASAAGLRLERVVMERVRLAGVTLRNAVVVDARFADCDLAGGQWDRAHLGRVEIDGCRLVGAAFPRATFSDLRMREVNGEMAMFIGAAFTAARLERCNFRGASFQGADLRGAVFRDCDLRTADLSDAKLDGADLRGSQIAGVGMDLGRLRGLVLDPAQALDIVQQMGITLQPLDEGE